MVQHNSLFLTIGNEMYTKQSFSHAEWKSALQNRFDQSSGQKMEAGGESVIEKEEKERENEREREREGARERKQGRQTDRQTYIQTDRKRWGWGWEEGGSG